MGEYKRILKRGEKVLAVHILYYAFALLTSYVGLSGARPQIPPHPHLSQGCAVLG